MRLRFIGSALALGMAMVMPEEGRAQTEETTTPDTPAAADTPPATPDAEVPPVEVVQPKPAEPAAPRVTAQPRPRPAPRPVTYTPPPPPPVTPIEPEEVISNELVQPTPGFYGPPGGRGNFERSVDSSQSPIVPTQGIVPGNLIDFSSAASRVTRQQIDEFEPLTTNDILQRVPGVAIINDDGLGRHGGISIRGTPARRSRKVLVMEDGRSINQSLYLDPSTHYTPPPDRIESVEVLRGTVITYGPNNNSGVVNFRNLQPFGPSESVAKASGGLGGHDATQWHTHTRQTSGNWGIVLSYSGANAEGAWNTERLRYNDFYAALGWKGIQSDFTFSAVYFAQRDNYDESNFEGDDDDPPGFVEREFFNRIKHCKTCFNPGSKWNEYNADLVLLQGIYNYYVNEDTTVSARVYGQLLERGRYFNLEGANPRAQDTSFSPVAIGDEIFIPEGAMEGRLRNFDNIGTELRTEFANRPFLFGLNQDLQVGVRYEHHAFADKAFVGRQGQILDGFDSRGLYYWNRDFTADAFSAFVQTDISVTNHLNVVPGVRLETYSVDRLTKRLAGDDDEEDVCTAPDGTLLFGGEECIVIEDFTDDPFNESFDATHVLPGVAFAYGFGAKQTVPVNNGSKSTKPQYQSTVYGGYHRGLTMGVLRESPFPPGDELGDNFQLGLRSVALKGVTFDVAGFHQRIKDYQIAAAVTTVAGDTVFSLIDEVHVNGVEAYSRLDTRPYTGWKLNPYLEGSYTLADNKIEDGESEDGFSVAGNYVPEVPREVAYLTAGIESTAGWNASVSFIYRGSFFTDVENTPYAGDPEGENGEVPSVWLLAARANYTIPNTNAVIFISGENLTDELYITDREDGLKPGIGRTVILGAKYKW